MKTTEASPATVVRASVGTFERTVMNSPALRRCLAVIALAFACSAHADCPFPKAPASIPDGKTASQEEMMGAMTAFKAYNDEVTAFSACVEQESKSAASMQMKAMSTKKINAAVDELQAKAKLFNEQVRIFKAR